VALPANNDVKEQVRASNDIVDVVGSYLSLRRQGRQYVALCPWHDDSRPSFQINPERQSWRCWVCGIGGDVFNFVMRRESIDFREALELLADRANIQLAGSGPAAPSGSPGDKRTLYNAVAWAERIMHQALLNDPIADPARRYLDERGISRDAIQRFHLGFSPNDWQWLCNLALQSEYGHDVLEAAGLIGRGQSGNAYDRFKGRVIFPIRDVQSRPIAFGGRILPQWTDQRSAKYVNSPETRLFSKSDQVYALDLARDAITTSGKVIVVEGYTDVIALHEAGVKNAVAVLGTALGPRHVQLLKRFADTVYLVLDGDEAGQKRTSEVLELFIAQQVDLRILTLPDGLDPCDFVQNHGPVEFQKLLASALDALDHKIRMATQGIDLVHDVHGANDALEEILDTLSKAPVLSSSSSSEVRLREHQFLAKIARLFQVEESELRTRLSALRKTAKLGSDPGNAPSGKRVDADQLNSWDRSLFELLLQNPHLLAVATDEIGPDELLSEVASQLFQAMLEVVGEQDEITFSSWLDQLEDENLRFLLIQLDESSANKNFAAPENELQHIISAYRRRHEDRDVGQQIDTMRTAEVSEREKIDWLQQIIEQQRNRQGISDPTDG